MKCLAAPSCCVSLRTQRPLELLQHWWRITAFWRLGNVVSCWWSQWVIKITDSLSLSHHVPHGLDTLRRRHLHRFGNVTSSYSNNLNKLQLWAPQSKASCLESSGSCCRLWKRRTKAGSGQVASSRTAVTKTLLCAPSTSTSQSLHPWLLRRQTLPPELSWEDSDHINQGGRKWGGAWNSISWKQTTSQAWIRLQQGGQRTRELKI